MKPFDIELAKAGHPVCTRDGRKVRIVCFDMKGSKSPIVALVEVDGREVILRYNEKGNIYISPCDYDLMMLPEKKEGWAIICESELYESEEIALKDAKLFKDYIKTIKVEWEE